LQNHQPQYFRKQHSHQFDKKRNSDKKGGIAADDLKHEDEDDMRDGGDDDDEGEEEDGDEAGGGGNTSEMLSLANFKTNILQMFLHPDRKLDVQEVRLVFDPATARGKRKAFHDGLVVISATEANVFRRSSLWTRGVITGIPILPIDAMKRIGTSASGPQAKKKLVKKGLSGLTAAQRTRQALGGCQINTMLINSALDGVPSEQEAGPKRSMFWAPPTNGKNHSILSAFKATLILSPLYTS